MKILITEEQLSAITRSNFDRVMDEYFSKLPVEYRDNLEVVRDLIRGYITKTGYNVKFLNSCSTGFAGVRTNQEVIVCAPNGEMGDFIYTIFHEIRHEQQISEIKMPNPLSEFDLEDFENIYQQYWEMELDADQFAKNMVAKLIIKSKIPINIAKIYFSLSPYIKSYPTFSNQIRNSISFIINEIKKIKASGEEYLDIRNHPMVAQHIEKLEDFI